MLGLDSGVPVTEMLSIAQEGRFPPVVVLALVAQRIEPQVDYHAAGSETVITSRFTPLVSPTEFLTAVLSVE